jgi:hypothetical protein
MLRWIGGSSLLFLVGLRNSDERFVSHFLFADTLIFCKANLDHFCYLHCLFLCFEAI